MAEMDLLVIKMFSDAMIKSYHVFGFYVIKDQKLISMFYDIFGQNILLPKIFQNSPRNVVSTSLPALLLS